MIKGLFLAVLFIGVQAHDVAYFDNEAYKVINQEQVSLESDYESLSGEYILDYGVVYDGVTE